MKPKTDPRRIRFGAPWVYANELVTDRRTRALAPGAIAILEDEDRRVIGQVSVNVESKIIARMMEPDMSVPVDAAWVRAKIDRALAHRDRLFADPFYRLVHAEADGLPGVIIDRFGDLCVIQPNAAWAENMFDDLAAAVVGATGCKTVIKNGTGRARGLEGLAEVMEVPIGTAPDATIAVAMNGATYMADVTGGQKTGLFFDQRPNHAFAASLAKDASVLDVFSHVGGFSLAALSAGASSALAVDSSQPALTLAQAGADAMGVTERFETLKSDAFAALTKLAEEGRTFDVVVCDPPAFAPARAAQEAGLRAYEKVARLATPLVKPGGYLGVCSCSHAVDLPKFFAATTRGIGRGGRPSQLIYTGQAGPDHPLLPQLAESGYLKALFFRL
jgi:23S rRNA (cytosine1962-C5)-methyltransferase